MANLLPPQARVYFAPKTILMVIALLALTWALYQVRSLIFLLLLSVLLSSALYPAIAWLKKRKFPRSLSILGFYLLFILIAAGIILMLANLAIEEGQQFLMQLPQYVNTAIAFFSQFQIIQTQDGALETLSGYLGNLVNEAIRFLFTRLNYLLVLVQGIIGVVTILVFSFFMILETAYFEQSLLRLVPRERRDKAQVTGRLLVTKVGAYVRGQLLVMLITGTLTWLGLALLGVQHSFILGLMVFILDIVPILGPIVATAFGVIIALGQSPILALLAFLVFFVVQQVEGFLLAPLILGRSVGIHPFWVLVSILTGGLLFGIVGILVAVPVALIINLIFNEICEPDDPCHLPSGES